MACRRSHGFKESQLLDGAAEGDFTAPYPGTLLQFKDGVERFTSILGSRRSKRSTDTTCQSKAIFLDEDEAKDWERKKPTRKLFRLAALLATAFKRYAKIRRVPAPSGETQGLALCDAESVHGGGRPREE
jgi:hypothetical protein